ncbi:MAG: glycosyltransferase family 1 protein [Proteobacteria bacterium]|nr:glycosyltransferase family 1 protein [Burkholderiales bacterium]
MTSHVVDVTMFWSGEAGGVARYLRSKHQWLEAKPEWRHSIVTPAGEAHEVRRVRSLPLPGSAGYRVPIGRARATALMRRLAPDIIEAGDPYQLAWAALDAGQQCSVPVVAFCHSDLESVVADRLGTWAERAARRYLRNLYSNFDAVLAPSRWMARRLEELGVERVVRQPLGVECEVFHPRRRDPDWRSSIGVSPETHVLLYAGRFAAEKRLSRLVEAVRLLGPGHVLVCIGNGPQRPSGERVIVLPYHRDAEVLARAIASADVFVHAGESETFGLAALEAMACGTPVVGVAAAGIGELLVPEVGARIEERSAGAFADGVRSVLAREQTSLRAAARAHALGFDWSVTFTQMVERYRRLRQMSVPAPIPQARYAG